jgi:hypothetical protein
VPWTPGNRQSLFFAQSGLAIKTDSVPQYFEYNRISEIELSGRGRLTKNAGIFGGGFGLGGAAEGMLAAAAINRLTTKSWMETFVWISGDRFEMFFHHAEMTPGDLRIALSPVLPRLGTARPEASSDDVAQQLSKMGDMFSEGLLTAEEFASAKARILRETGQL